MSASWETYPFMLFFLESYHQTNGGRYWTLFAPFHTVPYLEFHKPAELVVSNFGLRSLTYTSHVRLTCCELENLSVAQLDTLHRLNTKQAARLCLTNGLHSFELPFASITHDWWLTWCLPQWLYDRNRNECTGSTVVCRGWNRQQTGENSTHWSRVFKEHHGNKEQKINI